MALLLPLPLAAGRPVTGEVNPEASKRFKFYSEIVSAAAKCTLFNAGEGTKHHVHFLVDNPLAGSLRSMQSSANLPGELERSSISCRSFFSQQDDMCNGQDTEDEFLVAILAERCKTTYEAEAVASGEKIIKRGSWKVTGGPRVPCVVALPQDGPEFGENQSALLNELKVLKRLNGSTDTAGLGVIRLLAAVTDCGMLRVVTELVNPMGYDLSLVISKYASFMDSQSRDVAFMPATEVCGLLEQIVSATRFLHDSGILHRDLKPENVLVTDKVHIFDGVRRVSQIKIIDFGCSAILDKDGLCRTPLLRTGDNIAPEVLMHLPHGPMVDAYGIGSIVHRTGNLELEHWAECLLDEDYHRRWSLERLSEEIAVRLLMQGQHANHIVSHLNALGMIVKVEGLVAATLLGEELQPATMIQLQFRSKGLHIVLLKHEGELLDACPRGSSSVQNGDRLVALVDPSVSDSARPSDLRLLLGVQDSVDLSNDDRATLKTSYEKRSLRDSSVLPCFIEFDEVEMPSGVFRDAEAKFGVPAICIMGPKCIGNPPRPYLSDEEKQNLRTVHAKEESDSIVVVYLNLTHKLPKINVSGIAHPGENGDEFIWPDGKRGICEMDRLLLARFDLRNTGSSESTHQLDEVQKALAACCDFEMDTICVTPEALRTCEPRLASDTRNSIFFGQCVQGICSPHRPPQTKISMDDMLREA